MKFDLKDFVQLDTKELLSVNGGGTCSSSSSPGGSCSSSGGSPGGGNCSYGGGSCSGNPGSKPPANNGAPACGSVPPSNSSDPDAGLKGGGDCSKGGSSCGGAGSSGGLRTVIRDNHDGTITTFTFYPNGSGTIVTTEKASGAVLSSHNYSKYEGNSNSNSSSESPSGNSESSSGSSGTGTNNDSNSSSSDSSESEASGTGWTQEELHNNGGGHSSNPTGGSTGGQQNNTTQQESNVTENQGGNTSVIPPSGSFGQITDGSYADELTMQYYKNLGTIKGLEFDQSMNDGIDSDGKIIDNLFSNSGCLMACTAKVTSQETGQNISLQEINQKVDIDSDGLLSVDEISAGLNLFLDEKFGDVYDVIGKNIENLSLDTLKSLSNSSGNNTTYVLGFAPSCYGGHWVVLEGYNTDVSGKIVFTYDGSSDNDVGRQYVLGTAFQETKEKIYGITRIETYTIIKK